MTDDSSTIAASTVEPQLPVVFDPEVRQLGFRILRATANFGLWVRRREEVVTYGSASLLSRTVRVDLDLNQFAGGTFDPRAFPTWERGRILVPLALLRRSESSLISVVDETQALLPRLNKEEERELVLAGLLELARVEHLAGRLPETTCIEEIREFLRARPPSGSETGSETSRFAPISTDGQTLNGNPTFLSALYLMHENYLLLAPIDVAGATRRVLTYSYLESFPSGQQEPGQRRITVDVPGAQDAQSYHFVFDAPPAVKLRDAEIVLQSSNAGANRPYAAVDRLDSQAHIYIERPPPATACSFNATLRVARAGTVRTAMVTSILASVTLLFAAFIYLLGKGGEAPGFKGKLDPSGVSALLVLLPGLAGSVLSAADHHPLTASLLSVTKARTWVVSVCSFVGAGLVAMNVSGTVATATWVVVNVVALATTVLLVVQFLSTGNAKIKGQTTGTVMVDA